jgi:Tfp pilus assembly protein PilZ
MAETAPLKRQEVSLHYQNSERRSALRTAIVVTKTRIGDERQYFFGYAKSLSKTGAFFHTLTPKNVGEEFNIEFAIPRTDIVVKCQARVVWKREFGSDDKLPPGMGIEFIDIDPEIGEKVDEWINKCEPAS